MYSTPQIAFQSTGQADAITYNQYSDDKCKILEKVILAANDESLCQTLGKITARVSCDNGKVIMKIYSTSKCTGTPVETLDSKQILPPNTCGKDLFKTSKSAKYLCF